MDSQSGYPHRPTGAMLLAVLMAVVGVVAGCDRLLPYAPMTSPDLAVPDLPRARADRDKADRGYDATADRGGDATADRGCDATADRGCDATAESAVPCAGCVCDKAACCAVGDLDPADRCRRCTSPGQWTPVRPCVTTLAGDGTRDWLDGPAATARFDDPWGVAIDAAGTIYVSDMASQRLRQLKSGLVSTIAGTGSIGAQDGPALSATFNHPAGLTLDSSGIVIADHDNSLIRRLASGQVTTISGAAGTGYLDGALKDARFQIPKAVAWYGNALYVVDAYNNRIRMIGSTQVSTVAGSGAAGSLDGAPLAAQFDQPGDLAFASSGTLYIADTLNHRIRSLAGGQVKTVAGSTAGFLDGPVASARFDSPYGVAVAPDGSVLVVERGNHRVRIIAAGQVSTLAGDGTAGYLDGPAAAARFSGPTQLVLDGAGNAIVTDSGNNRLRQILR